MLCACSNVAAASHCTFLPASLRLSCCDSALAGGCSECCEWPWPACWEVLWSERLLRRGCFRNAGCGVGSVLAGCWEGVGAFTRAGGEIAACIINQTVVCKQHNNKIIASSKHDEKRHDRQLTAWGCIYTDCSLHSTAKHLLCASNCIDFAAHYWRHPVATAHN